jgi:hypothetical protein
METKKGWSMRYVIPAVTMALCVCGSVTAVDQKPRLAILASGGNQAQAIVDLVEVSLSGKNDIEVIDRDQVDKVLAEHRLQSKNMVSFDDRLSTARLLGCDVFAELRGFAEKEQRALVLRALDARSGARLIDVSIDLSLSLEGQVQSVAVAIGDALQKVRNGEEGKGIPVSIGEIREVGLPVEYRHLPGTLRPLLERYLLMSRTISVLERERLGLLNREAEIAEDTRSQLLGSAVVIDVDVSLSAAGGVRMRASMSDTAGKEVAHAAAEGEWDTYGSVLVELVQAIARELRATSFEISATSLWRDASRTAVSSSLESGIALGEAALAMDSSNEVYHRVLLAWYQSLLRKKYTKRDYKIRISVSPKKEYSLAALTILERCVDILEIGSNDMVELGRSSGRKTKKDIGRWFVPSLIITEGLLVDEADAARLRKVRQRILSHHHKTRSENGNLINGPLLVAGTENVNQLIETVYTLWKSENMTPPLVKDRYVEGKLTEVLSHVYPGAHPPRGARDVVSDENKTKLMELYAFWASDPRLSPEGRVALQFTCLRWAFVHRKLFANYDEIIHKHLAEAKGLVLKNHNLVSAFGRHIDRTNWGEAFPKVSPEIDRDRLVIVMRELLEVMREEKVACPDLLSALDWYDTEGAYSPGMYLDEAIRQQEDHQYRAFSHRSFRWATGQRNFGRKAFISALEALRRKRYGEKPQQEIPIEVPIKRVCFAFPGVVHPDDTNVVRDNINVENAGRILAATLCDDLLYLALVESDRRQIDVISYSLKSGEMLTRGSMPRKDMRSVKSMHIGDHIAYMPTDRGLVVLPLDETGEGWVLDEEVGMPAENIDAVCEYRGRVYIACNRTPLGRSVRSKVGCYFVTCNLDGSDIKILATNARKEKLSPLDSMRRFIINSILADPTNHQLIFPAYGDIWACDIETGKIENLAKQIQYPILLGKNQKDDLVIQEHYPGLIWSSWNPDAKKRELISMRANVLPVFNDVASDDLPAGFPLFDHMFFYTVSGPARRVGGHYPPTNETKWELCNLKSNRLDFRTSLPSVDAYAPFFLARYKNELIACTRLGLYVIDPIPITRPGLEAGDVNTGKVNSGNCDLSVVSETGGILILDDKQYKMWPNQALHWKTLKPGKHNISLDWYGLKWCQEVHLVPGEKAVVEALPDAKPENPFVLDMGKGVSMQFVWVPKGECNAFEIDKEGIQGGTVHRVDKGFWMGQYEVTRNQYQRVVDPDKPVHDLQQYPAVGMSWDEVSEFCDKVNQSYAERLAGKSVRIPTKEEWEYAFWGARKGRSYFGGSDEIWNRYQNIAPVGALLPNHFWLYDMLGNAHEWCSEMDVSNKFTGTFSSYLTQCGYEEWRFPDDKGLRLVIEER